VRKLGLAALVLLPALVAFYVGTRYRAASSPAPAGPAAAQVADPAADARREAEVSALPESQPVRTYRGPDGRPHLISYDAAKPVDDHDAASVRAAVLEDMRNHPRNIAENYDLPLADIESIVAGRKPYPDALLPAPAN
jgi:hypothetical protein